MSASGGTLDEKDENAIYDYMTSGVSYSLNYALRSGIPLTEEQQRVKRDLDKALCKLPDYTGIVYRSLSSEYMDLEEFLNYHKPGSIVSYSADTSTSKQIYDDTMDIQMIIKVKHGKDISKWNENESEVLLMGESFFWVVKVDGRKIYLEELG